MVGRGFLKSRLAQIAAQEVEDASKSENNNSIDVSTINNEPILGNNKPAARGRRAIFSRSAENSEFSETSRLSSLTLENSKNPECQMFPVPPVCQNGKVPKQCTSKIQLQSTTNLQQHPIPTEALTENNKPVICRVTENHKNNFKMYDILNLIFHEIR
uniref:Uncharacterized protein n=1 Tax=Sipha flava TaxID=143950 RepID=A0A2S2QXB3_9HEMI